VGSSSGVASGASAGVASGTSSGAASGSGSEVDAGPANDAEGDGGFCVNIDVSTYDTSCGVDSDCINIAPGMICDGYNCLCGGAAVSAGGQARYNAALASVKAGAGPFCGCPAFGWPRCINVHCVYCPNPLINRSAPAPAGCQ
jgi:hypothetical protein